MITLKRGGEIVKDALLETLSETPKRKERVVLHILNEN